ncbi:MAG: aspartate aminotransferase family protein [Halobacteriovoraceae bacterium]|nr:aspartate aminotransferase family protein [Halobacteriovoraceae bacterium]|tara:strand:+ start:13017 stop:14276 length:1260 start_codon:yes stop_codon:yes gene_type:complete
MNSNELFQKSLKYVPGGVHSPVRSFKGLHTTPRFINKAEGARIVDEDGKDYIDFCMSFGPLILGHRNPQVEEAVIAALKNGWSFGACEKYSLELAEFIVERIPFIDKIRFVNSGTEAVMTAIRLARGYTGKNKIIKFDGCYHGHTDSMLIKAGSGLAGTTTASSQGVSPAISNDTLICELGNLEQLKEVMEQHKNDLAAVFIEPLPANNGLLIQNAEFLKAVKELTDQYSCLLVFDEVISGFRVSFQGMYTHCHVEPDIVTYGKIIGGGFPVGAVAARSEIMDKLAPVGDVYQAGTLSANPVAMVAGLANLQQLTDNFYEKLERQSLKLVNIFSNWLTKNGFEDYSLIHFQSLFWAIPTHDKIINSSQIPGNIQERFKVLFEELLNKGIYFSPNAYEVGFVSSAHDDDVLSEIEQRLWQ